MFSAYMIMRKQRRIEYFNLVQSTLRLLMLGNMLDLPYTGWMDKMTISFFGIV